MKKLLTFLSSLLLACILTAEVPQRISYQSVVRDADNNLVTNAQVGMRISIQKRVDGNTVYVEQHFVTTNDNGLASLEVGDGTVVSGSMDDIDWSEGTFFIRTEVDPQGGTNYSISGTSQLLTVPYAFHAITAEGLTEEIVETDPVFEASAAADISLIDISNWDEAFSWGDHTLEGYLTEETDPLFSASPAAGIQSSDIDDWDAAFSWGDHSLADYLTEETDPLFSASPAADIQSSDIDDWDAAFSWGDHTQADYITEETDPLFSASPAAAIETSDIIDWDAAFSWGNHALEGYLTDESDPLFSASPVADIEEDDIANWDDAFGWGDHADADYLTEETDPLFSASPAADIDEDDIDNWDEAFDWGDHAAEDYLTEETDPLFSASPAADIEEDDIANWDDAFGWGDHADADYLTEETQTLADVLALGNDANEERIENLADPTAAQDAATKAYVDLLEEKIDLLLDRIETLEAEMDIIVEDIDGNRYNIVGIGTQTWMTENLRVTHYNDGSEIDTGLSASDWETATDGAYAIYPHEDVDGIGSDEEMADAYGKLYNWYAVESGKLCPEGWRVPNEDDWNILLAHLEEEGYDNEDEVGGAGNALKSCRQVDSPAGVNCDTEVHPRWDADADNYGTDDFGFSALPAGLRRADGSFGFIGSSGRWWVESGSAQIRTIYYDKGNIVSFTSPDERNGISVRCIRIENDEID